MGGLACASESQALFCESFGSSANFISYACPGNGGCISDGKRAACDLHGSAAGSACPASMVSLAFCNGTTFLQCENASAGRVWVATSCSQCSEQDGRVTCKP